MHAVQDHGGRLVGIPPDHGRREWQERDKEELEHIEKERGTIDTREVAQVDGVPDPIRA